MEITSPSGKTYQWNKATPPTQEDIARLKAFDSAQNQPATAPVAQAAAPTQAPAAQAAPSSPDLFHSDIPVSMSGATFNVNPAGVANAVKDMGLEGGGIALGQAAGAPFAEFGGVQAGGAIGGFLGSVAAQLSNFSDPKQKFSLGRAGANAGLGMIPGSFLAKPAVSLGTKAAALGAANVAATNYQKLVDFDPNDSNSKPYASPVEDAVAFTGGTLAPALGQGFNRGATAAKTAIKAGNDAENRASINMAKELGLVFPPPATNPNAVNNTLNSLAGKASTAQEALIRNQPVVDSIIRRVTGIPEGKAISVESLNTARVSPNLAYEEVAKMTPASDGLLAAFKQKQADANMAFGQFKSDLARGVYNPGLKQQGEQILFEAKQLRNALSKEAAKVSNGKELMDNLDAASRKLATIGLSQQALHNASGKIDAAVIGDAFEFSPQMLSGDMLKLGRAQSVFGKYIKDATGAAPSGVDYMRLGLKLGGGASAALAGHPVAGLAVPIGMTMAEKGAQRAILSPFYQRNFTTPYYGSTAPDFAAVLAAQSAMSAGRKN